MADARPDVERGASRPSRVPPHNLQAEESLLGAMLLSKDAIASAVESVGIDDFYKPAHGHVFDAITSLYGAGEPVDPVTVAEELRRAGLLDAIGGQGALVGLQATTPATASAARYAKIDEEHALLRPRSYVAGDIAENAYAPADDVTNTIDQAEPIVFSVAERRVTDTTKDLDAMLNAYLDRLAQLYERKEDVIGLPTGYADLDTLLSGLQPSALLVVGARPSMGKTAFALGIARHAAIRVSKPVLLFSLEMSQLEVTERIMAAEANVDSKKLRNGRLAAGDWTRIQHAAGRMASAPLYVDDNASVTVMDIRAKARRLKSRVGNLGVIIVDYIQLMTGRGDRENRQVEVSEISRNLKILARELETPVIALAQLNRQLETRADKRPMLADLRESGSIEQDADVVMFLYRDEVYNPDAIETKGIAEVIVAKHRSGPTDTIRLAWLAQSARFENMGRDF